MRRVLFSLVLGLLFYVSSLAQNNVVDVVTLKNGSVIRGIILEQVPNKNIKVQTADGSIFVYTMAEVERINREQRSHTRSYGVSDGKKGYIGLSLGASFGQGYNEARVTGLNLNLVDFGYLFHEHIGITARWGGQGYSINGVGLGIGYVMAGPMGSWRIAERARLEVKGMIGWAAASVEGFTSKAQFTYGFELQSRIHISKQADFLGFLGYNAINDYNAISLGIGIAFRLK